MRLCFDIESNGLLHDITKVHCLVAENLETGEVLRYNHHGLLKIEHGLKVLESATELVGHNVIGYDIPAIQKIYPWFNPKATVRDTQVMAQLYWPDRFALMAKDVKVGVPPQLKGTHKLAAWGYRLKELKGTYGKSEDDADEDVWAEWSQEMEDYCAQDVKVTTKLWQLLVSKGIDPNAMKLEHDFKTIITKQERHGFRLDVEATRHLYVMLSKRRLELETKLQEVFPPLVETMKTPEFYTAGGLKYPTKGAARAAKHKDNAIVAGPLRTKLHPFNPGSTDQIADRLIQKYAWKPLEFTDGGKPKVTETIVEEMVYAEAPLLCAYMKTEKILGMVGEGDQAWLKVEKKGRIHGRVNTNGAVSGRCTHSSPNVAQVPKVQKNKAGILKQEEGGWGWECRSLFVPDAGHTMVGFDASGLELRCLAHFMARYDDGAYAKVLLEGDVHSVNQEAAGLPTRDNAKTFIYAFLYGAGDAKIGSIVGGGAREGKRLKAKFLAGLPALDRLKTAVANAVAARGFLFGLDGRHLPIRSKHAALNTLLQSAGALIMKQALIFLYQELTTLGLVFGKDYAFVANIHDEAQISCRPELAEQIGKLGAASIKRAGEHFKFRCPLAGEYKIGLNWAETH